MTHQSVVDLIDCMGLYTAIPIKRAYKQYPGAVQERLKANVRELS